MKKVTAFFLSLTIVLTVFSGCGIGKNKDIHTAEVTLPVPTNAQTAVNVTTSVALDYYLSGRAYLDKFLNFDISSITEQNFEEYRLLLKKSIEAFENTDKTTAALSQALDTWDKEPESTQKPSQIVMLSASPSDFGMTVYAAERGSKEWAQELVDAYDKAPAGKGIRTLASQLDTDAKHAYAQLKQALAVLEGAEYTEIAEKANTAVKTASVLKTAGTAAGLVIAVATAPASGALATAVSTGGITMSGVNTVLEIGSTGSILYTNGEDNEFSMACDKTEAQLAPIGQVFAVAGLTTSLRDVGTTAKDAWNNGYRSLDEKTKTDLAMNTFGIISYGATSINDYVNDGSILSGTFKADKDGIKFTLKDTLTGTEPEKQRNVKEMLTSSGIDEKKVADALSTAKENPEPVKFQTESMPDATADAIIKQKAAEDDFDIDAYLEKLRSVLIEIAEMENEQQPSGEPASEPAPEPEPQAPEKEAGLDAFLGAWHYTETYKIGDTNYTTHITFTMTKTSDGISVKLDIAGDGGTEHESYRCGYAFNGKMLTVTHDDFEGGMITFELMGADLKGTSGDGETVIMTR